MFERYTERARRSIFFGRYEASMFGSLEITAEYLLLGILRDDRRVALQLGLTADGIRKELEQIAAPTGERISTSVDMPLTMEAKRALAYAAEESDALKHRQIDSEHLVLGLLRVEECLAAKLLRAHGVEYDKYRASLERPVQVVPLGPTGPFETQAAALRTLLDSTLNRVQLGKADGEQHLKRKPWTRVEALGHLIDWGMAHQMWLTQAILESKLTVAGYPDESDAAIARYADFQWPEAVDLWASLNRLLAHVIEGFPDDKLTVPCKIGIADPVPLSKLIEVYIEHCQDIVGQILARLD